MAGLKEKARVGETGLTISRVGLGGAPLGNLYSNVAEGEALETIERALGLGLSHLDTAPFYGLGAGEERMGKALATHKRGEYTLSTKVGRILVPSKVEWATHWADTRGLTAVFDFSEEGVLRSVEESRKRLRTERFEILLIHDCDGREDEALTHSYPVLNNMKEEGEVDAIGAGLNSYETALKLARRARFDCFLIAGRYTLLEQGPLDEFFPFCRDHRIGVIAGGVFNSGILATGPVEGAKYNYADAPPEILDRAKKIKEVCDGYRVGMRSVALQFVLANPAVTSVVVGCRSPGEVEANAGALEQKVPGGLWDDLKGNGLLREDAPTP